MAGKYKIIFILFIMFCGCKKQNNINNEGKKLIKENINILLDSVEMFDIPPAPGHENVVKTKITLGLIDSLKTDTVYSSEENELKSYKYLQFKLDKNDLNTYKSYYKLFFQKNRSLSTDVLNIEISNLRINEFEASVEVSKVIGISMISDRFYFKKEKDIWIFKKKEFLGRG